MVIGIPKSAICCTTNAQAYDHGWAACAIGVDGRIDRAMLVSVGYIQTEALADAWYHGWNDCFEREDDSDYTPGEFHYGEDV